jgi:hypothetical protein
MLAAVAVGLGVVLGFASGGKLAGLEKTSLKFQWVMIVLFLLQAVARGRLLGPFYETPFAVWTWVVTSAALLVVLALSWKQAGVAIAGVGILLNLDIVLGNGGMPVDVGWEAASDAGGIVSVFYHAANSGSLISVLGDVLRLQIAGSTYMLSAGDVLTGVGVLVFIVSRMLATESQGETGGSRAAAARTA